MALAEGDKAPDFTMNRDGEGTVSLADYKGKNLILYFYPKDDTPGCTKQACGFQENLPDFSGANAEILGVSKDSVKRHDKFKTKYDLEFPLGSDEDGVVCEAYGVWVEKMNYGRKYMGIERSTFLIDGDGKIVNIWRKVRVKDHVEKVLDAVKAL